MFQAIPSIDALMPTLYVSEPNATVRKSGSVLTVTSHDDPDGPEGPEPAQNQTVVTVALEQLEGVVIIGRNHITAGALRACMDNGVSVSWLTRGGRLVGRAMPELPRSADLRVQQYATATAPDAIQRARKVVLAKLTNTAAILTDIQSNYPGDESLKTAGAAQARFMENVHSAPDIETLHGVEGASARAYFEAYGAAFKSGITFTGRNRRPPKDPANAMLSFGYTLLGNLLGALLEARGLDPCLGFFHEIRPGRQSLALDLLEEFRAPVVDRFVLRSCNLRIFRPEMFRANPESGGVLLTDEARRVFFREWERNLLKPVKCAVSGQKLPPHGIIRRQVNEFAMSLRENRDYEPFLYGGY